MVYLFDRPILPYYDKGKKTARVVSIFKFFFENYAATPQSSANLEYGAYNSLYEMNYAPLTGRVFKIQKNVVVILWSFAYLSPERA